MRLKLLFGLAAFAFILPASAAIPATATTELVEFYNKKLDHYFVTVEPKEIQDLDSGVHEGWARTGYRFLVIKAGSAYPESVPVCRFYGRPEAELDSHFYSAKVSECQEVKDKFSHAWQLESDEVFRAFLVDPMTGKCPTDASPVYRLWNQRPDVNHRYSDQISVYQEMVNKAYKGEGDGNPALPVAFCAAGGSVVPAPPPGSPTCTITGSSSTPPLGSTLTLNAACTDAPTGFNWVGCTSTTSQCKVSQATAGTASYSVTATNAAGTGSPVTLNVTWGGATGALPQCSIFGSSGKPTTGGTLTLSASCSQTPTSYQWTECDYVLQQNCAVIATCSPTLSTCAVSSNQSGFARYAVAGVNGIGTGPRVGLDVEWTTGGGNPPGSVPSCSVISSNATPVVGNSIVLSANCSGSPATFAWTGVSCSGIQCSTSSPSPGPQTYTVTASNASGSGNPASLTVEWLSSPAPSCTLSTGNPTPTVGQTITINASCSGSPTSYAWAGCSGSGASCTDAATGAGAKSYALVASNGNGPGQQANLVVNWQAAASAPPVCSVTPSNPSPFVGQQVTLTANCSNNPTSYAWTNCSSSASTCVATSGGAGAQAYSATATNGFGSSTPASTVVNWQASSGGSGLCSAYSNVINLSTSWGDNSPIDTYSNGGFPGDGVVVVSFVAPLTYSSYANAGSTQVAEHQGVAATRQITLSRSACDFRTPDPSGANGPYALGNGNTATVVWNVGAGSAPLTPGETYYVSIRNWSLDLNNGTGGISCLAAGGGFGACNARIQFNWPSGGSGTPPPPPPGAAPSCSLSPSNASPTAGQLMTISASCSDSPTSYAWTGCAGSGASCTDTAANAGAKSYTLVASNNFGAGPQANLNVNWQAPPTAAPVCSVVASPTSAFVGGSAILTATCSNAPTSYAWTNCSSTSATCVATSTVAGVKTYSVTGSNAVGPSVPVGVNVDWKPNSSGSDFCGSYSNVNRLATGWGDNTPIDTYANGGFPGDGVVVISFVAPSSPPSYASAGSTQVAEHLGVAATRQITISKSACDFRAPDSTGTNGPYHLGNGNTATVNWNVGAGPAPLAPGQTYYINIRNWSLDLNDGAGGISCLAPSGGFGSCNARIQFNWPK